MTALSSNHTVISQPMRAAALRIAILAASAMSATGAWGWTERAVSLPAQPAPLHGTLTWPDGNKPAPAVLILAGSGPVDRDGNLPNVPINNLKLLAHALAGHGIASLRIDKRGIAASRAALQREEDIRIDNYAADAVAWLEMLRAEPRVQSVALLGHSEGALIATLAAQRTQVEKLVLVAGAGAPAGGILRRQLATGGLPDTWRAEAERIIGALERGEPVGNVPPEFAATFRPSVRPYLISWFQLDPAAELRKVRAPVLIVQGTTDLQVSVDDAHKLHAARPDATLALVPSMNHVLKIAPPDRAQNLATYGDPDLPLAAEFVSAVATFLGRDLLPPR